MEQLKGSLDDFVLRNILEFLEIQDHLLLELRCFGTRLKTIIDAIIKDRFLNYWSISNISGSPPSPTAFITARLCNFYRCHPVATDDSLTKIAVKYGTDVSALRRVNNIISDHTLASRNEIYVPIQDASQIEGSVVSFEYHSAAHKRPMLVIHPPPPFDPLNTDTITTSGSSAPPTPTCNQNTKYHKSNTLLQQMLQKTLAIDATTAGYYLSAADGDPRAAIKAYQEDQKWDTKMRHLKRSLGSTGGKQNGKTK